VRRLFENYGVVEREYYRKTKIFPIMHTVVIRRDVYRQNPWSAQSLHKAFVLSQRDVYANLHETAGLKAMLPWVTHSSMQRGILMKRNLKKNLNKIRPGKAMNRDNWWRNLFIQLQYS
jgi:hypothetical protein